jgi:hypothetical protein
LVDGTRLAWCAEHFQARHDHLHCRTHIVEKLIEIETPDISPAHAWLQTPAPWNHNLHIENPTCNRCQIGTCVRIVHQIKFVRSKGIVVMGLSRPLCVDIHSALHQIGYQAATPCNPGSNPKND